MVIPFVLQFSCRLPVSVCGTGTSIFTLAVFLASVNSSASLLFFAPLRHPALRHAYFTTCQPHDLAPAFHPRSPTILLCPCFELLRWYGNIYPLSIIYAFRPQLRSRLTLGGRTFPRKPQTFDGEVSRLSLATYAGILSSIQSTAASATASARIHCSSTDTRSRIPKLRCHVLAPLIFGASSLDQ